MKEIDITYARTLTDMPAFLQYLVSIYGAELYKDKQRLHNLIADLYAGEERQKKLFRRAIIEDNMALRVYELTKKTPTEREALIDAIAYQFAESNYLSNEIGQKTTLAFVRGLNMVLQEIALKQRSDGKWIDEQGNTYSKNKKTFEKANRQLSEMIIRERITKIGDGAFKGCTSLVSITIPDSVTEIGREAFRDCSSLVSTTIPDSVTEIGLLAFAGCTSLASITIPDSVTEIGDKAFADCTSLSSITIPDSVTEIGPLAFGGCYSLKTINVSTNNIYYKSIDGVLYSKDGSVLKQCPGAKMNCKIPDGVTEIGDWAFSFCTALSSITIPDGVTKIGRQAFRNCTALSSITIPDSVTVIGDSAFKGCTSLASITIPDGVTKIGDFAFEGCTSLKRIKTTREKFTWFRHKFPKRARLQKI